MVGILWASSAKHHAHRIWLPHDPLQYFVHIYSGLYLHPLAVCAYYMVYLMEQMDMLDMSSQCMWEIDLVVICWDLAPMAINESDGLATSLLDPDELNL